MGSPGERRCGSSVADGRSGRTSQVRRRKTFASDRRVALAGAIGVDRVGGEDCRAGECQDQCGDLDHDTASGLPMAARYLLRVRSQIRSKINCMLAIPVLLREITGGFVSALFRRFGKMVSCDALPCRCDDNIASRAHAAGRARMIR
jgi:hypothetical protein